MTKLTGFLPPALARPFVVLGGVLFLIGAMLPWATFLLNDGPYPDKAKLQFFDAPLELTGYRWNVLLFGVAAIIATFAPTPAKARVLRALGWGGLAISAITSIFIAGKGGGLGAITASDGNYAFGGIVGIVGGIALILAAGAMPLPDIPHWSTKIFGLEGWAGRIAAWVALLIAFAAVLYLVQLTLTVGGIGGAAFPYAGPVFLAFLGFAGGLLGALHGLGITGWGGRP